MAAILPVPMDKSPTIPTNIAVAIAESGRSLPWSNALGDLRTGPKTARPKKTKWAAQTIAHAGILMLLARLQER
jgi:hypothetical protein